MGLVRSITVDDGNAHVELLLTSGWCPFASEVLASVKEKAEGVEGIREVEVKITWDEAWTMNRLSDDARRKLVFLPDPISVSDRDSYIQQHSPATLKGVGDDQ